MARRWRDPESASDLGRLDPEAIAKVQAEAWPDPVNAEELHDALLWLGCLTEAEARAAPGWSEWLEALARDKRVALLQGASGGAYGFRPSGWLNSTRFGRRRELEPQIAPPADQAASGMVERTRRWSRSCAAGSRVLDRSRRRRLPRRSGLSRARSRRRSPRSNATARSSRAASFAGVNDEQWCDRRLLARIHHYTVRRLRSEIEPVAARDFLRFLFAWPHVAEETRLEGPDALPVVLSALEGFEAPAKAWETEILPARLKGYQASWLDAQCLAGRDVLGASDAARRRQRQRPRAPCHRRSARPRSRSSSAAGAPLWMALAPLSGAAPMSGRAQAVLDCFKRARRLFFDELAEAARLLRPQLEEALGELVALGLAASDSFGGLRALLVPSGQRKPLAGAKRRGRVLSFDIESGGRWAMINRTRAEGQRRGVARRGGRICGADAARSLWRRLLAPSDAGARMAAAVAGSLARLPPARGARGDSRRPFRRRILGRTIRAAGRGRTFARDAPPPGVGRVGVAVRRRSAQSDRHPDARAKAFGADRQSGRLSGRPAGRGADRRQGAVPDRARERRAVGGREAAGAIGGARKARRPRLSRLLGHPPLSAMRPASSN